MEKWGWAVNDSEVAVGKGVGMESCTGGLTGPLSLSLLESWPASSLACSISTRICTLPTLRSTLLVKSFVCWGGMVMGPHVYSNPGFGTQRPWALVPQYKASVGIQGGP